jgi:uncharacterized protein YjlB
MTEETARLVRALMPIMTKPLTLFFKDDGAVPNNPLPVLLYKRAVTLGADPASALERLFAGNGWDHGQWRDGIYPFTHYHSMIHETLGIARGTAAVRFGGDQGETVDLEPGDVAVLPAGTGHRRLAGSDDLLVIGAYPPEGTYNLCRGDNRSDHAKALTTIPRVPVPASDPVHGARGLPELWRR